MKDYELEIVLMEAELEETAEISEPGFFNKPMTKRERYGVTRRKDAKRRENSERKKARLKKYEGMDKIHELDKNRHWFTRYPDTNIYRVNTERQLPIRVRRKGVKE